MTIMEIYADGSLGRSSTAGLGWVLITEDGPTTGFTHLQVRSERVTIQHVELQALKAAIKNALATGADMTHAAVYTDSLDAIELIRAELRGTFPTATRTANRDLIRWLALEVRINNLHLRHVRGHNGTPGNDAADRLAVMARRNREYGLTRNHGHAMAANIAADYTTALTRTSGGAGKHWASPAAISLHRASGEPLCGACAHELQALEREAS